VGVRRFDRPKINLADKRWPAGAATATIWGASEVSQSNYEKSANRPGEIAFWIFFGIDVVIALVTLYFLLDGLGDGSVSSFNGGIWLLMIVGVLGVPAAAFLVRTTGNVVGATVIAALLAIPGLLFGAMMLLMMSTTNFH
jgi:hypothetical protein